MLKPSYLKFDRRLGSRAVQTPTKIRARLKRELSTPILHIRDVAKCNDKTPYMMSNWISDHVYRAREKLLCVAFEARPYWNEYKKIFRPRWAFVIRQEIVSVKLICRVDAYLRRNSTKPTQNYAKSIKSCAVKGFVPNSHQFQTTWGQRVYLGNITLIIHGS